MGWKIYDHSESSHTCSDENKKWHNFNFTRHSPFRNYLSVCTFENLIQNTDSAPPLASDAKKQRSLDVHQMHKCGSGQGKSSTHLCEYWASQTLSWNKIKFSQTLSYFPFESTNYPVDSIFSTDKYFWRKWSLFQINCVWWNSLEIVWDQYDCQWTGRQLQHCHVMTGVNTEFILIISLDKYIFKIFSSDVRFVRQFDHQ